MNQLLEKIRRATKRRHIKYRAKKDERVRHYILDKVVGDTENGNLQVMVFAVDKQTQRPTEDPAKFRELIPDRIEENVVKW